MAIEVITWVLDHSQSRNGARLVLIAIAERAKPNGAGAWPSVADLMRRAQLSERAVQNGIKELERLGELKVEWNKGQKGSNLYTVLMRVTPAESAPPQNLHPADSAGVETETESDTRSQDPPQNLHPAESAPPQNSTETPAESAPEPSLNRPSSSKRTTSSSQKRARGTRIPDDFKITPEMAAWGREKLPWLDGHRADAITDEFVDYWRAVPGAKGEKTDWPATWRNWLRREADKLKPGPLVAVGGRSSPPAGPRPSTADQRVAQALAAAEQVKAELRARRAS